MSQKEVRSAPDHIFGDSIQGKRSDQQDSFQTCWLEPEDAWLLVLGDGMGGHSSGGVASSMAVDEFVRCFESQRRKGVDLRQSLFSSLDKANTQLAEAQMKNSDLAGMGTTIVGAHLSSSGVAWISVGDSPMWLYRNASMTRLNADHSLRRVVGHGVRGVSNLLESALNGEQIPIVDCQPDPLPLQGGDLIVVGSDGLLTLSENEMIDIMRATSKQDPATLGRALLHAVECWDKSNQDNCTLLIAGALQETASSARLS